MKKGIGKIVFGSLLMVLPVVLLILGFVWAFGVRQSDRPKFVAPGSLEITVSEPGRYYLWHDHATVHEGIVYNQSTEITHGASIEIFDASGRLYEFFADDSISISSGNHSRGSIGYIDVDEPVDLSISVSGRFENQVWSFSPSSIGKILGAILGGVLLTVVAGVAGLIVLILGIVQYSRSRKEAKTSQGDL